jgi:hypothetical protein
VPVILDYINLVALFVISGRLWEHLQRLPVGQAFTAPIDVILPGLSSPVQPDLLFITAERLEIVKETLSEQKKPGATPGVPKVRQSKSR